MDKKYIPALIISVSLIISALIFGTFFYQAQKDENTLKSVGIASTQFESDTVKWNINLEEKVGPENLKDGYKKINSQINRIITILSKQGIETSNINKKPINVYESYEYKNQNGNQQRIFSGYRVTQSFYIVSNKVDKIEDIAYNPLSLLENNIVIRNSNLQYYYSNIDKLKKEIISKAAANARERANKMLEHTDVNLGKTLSLNSGVFQITEPHSTRVSSSGIYETSTKKKQIRVTVHAIYKIK